MDLVPEYLANLYLVLGKRQATVLENINSTFHLKTLYVRITLLKSTGTISVMEMWFRW